MNGTMNKTRFAMKRYREKITAEMKKVLLKENNVKKEWSERTRKQIYKGRIEEKIKQNELNGKKEIKQYEIKRERDIVMK